MTSVPAVNNVRWTIPPEADLSKVPSPHPSIPQGTRKVRFMMSQIYKSFQSKVTDFSPSLLAEYCLPRRGQ